MMSDVKVSKKNHKLTEIISKIAAHILTVEKGTKKKMVTFFMRMYVKLNERIEKIVMQVKGNFAIYG